MNFKFGFGEILLLVGILSIVGTLLFTAYQTLERHKWARRWEICKREAGEIVSRTKAQFGNVQCFNAITAEPDARASGKDADLAFEHYLDLLDENNPEDTPFTSSIGKSKPGQDPDGVNIDMQNSQMAWGLDTAPTPIGAVGWADNYAVQSTELINVLTNARKMGNVGQVFRRASGAGWIADAVMNTPGGRLIVRARNKVNVAIKQDIEAACCSLDQIAVQAAGSASASGGNMAGFRKLVDYANRYTDAATAFAYGKPTDLHYAPTGASFTGALSSTFTYSAVCTMMRKLREAGGEHNDFVFLCGLDVRDAITGFVSPAVSTASATAGALSAAATQTRQFTQAQADKTFGFSIGILKTDYGRVEVMESLRIGTTLEATDGGGSTAVRANRLFFSRPKSFLLYRPEDWRWHWGVRYETGDIPDTGQGKSFFVRSFGTLRVRNPIRTGFGDMT